MSRAVDMDEEVHALQSTDAHVLVDIILMTTTIWREVELLLTHCFIRRHWAVPFQCVLYHIAWARSILHLMDVARLKISISLSSYSVNLYRENMDLLLD